MEQSSKETLVKVINLIKKGDNKTAIPLLTALLKKEPKLEQGWYLLGMALEGNDKKARAFKQALKLNPDHEKAKKQLAKLEGSPPPAAPKPAPEPKPAPQEPPPQADSGEQAFFQEDDTQAEIEPPDASSEAETSGSMQMDFELPDWMQQDSFVAADQIQETTEPPKFDETETDSAPWESSFQDDNSEMPDWAKLSQPPPAPDLSEEAGETPSWLEEKPEPQKKNAEAKIEPAFTGYYLDEDEEIEEPFQDKLSDSTAVGEEASEESETEEGEPEWLRTMVEEDEGGNKGKKKKKKKRAKVERSPKEKKSRRRRIFMIAMILLCGGLGAANYFFNEQVQPYYTDYVEPYVETLSDIALTQAAPVTELLTEGAPLTNLLTPVTPTNPNYLTPSPTPFMTPTLAPTWTPTSPGAPTQTTPPTQQTDITPTPSPTSLPLPDETVLEIRTIQEQVVDVRELPGPNTVEDDIIPSLKLKLILQDWMLEDGVLESLENDDIGYKALGFVNSNYDLVTEALNSRVDSIGGLYLPEENRIYVVGNGFFGIQKYIYAHEYTHAIQDASFDLNGLGVYPYCTLSTQKCLAIMSLVEGDASLSADLWFETFPPELEYQDILSFKPSNLFFQGITPPVYFEQNAMFPYTYGQKFVQYLYQNGGWNSVNRAYQYLPETTEQIIHPEKYDARERPTGINYPDLTAIARDGWEIIRSDSLGEWETFLLLAYNDYAAAQQPVEEAEIAAAGWGGDQYSVLYNDETDETLLSVYWTWDTQNDSDEFYNGLKKYLVARFHDSQISDTSTGICWNYNNVQSCVYRQDKRILWLQSDNIEMLEKAKALFTAFP